MTKKLHFGTHTIPTYKTQYGIIFHKIEKGDNYGSNNFKINLHIGKKYYYCELTPAFQKNTSHDIQH